MIPPLARRTAGNSSVEERVCSECNGKSVLPITSHALHAVPNLQGGWILKVDLKAISLSPCSVLQGALYTPLLLHSARCPLVALTRLSPTGLQPTQSQGPCLIFPLVFPAPSTAPSPRRPEVYTYCIKLQVICLELSTHFPKEMHYEWEWKPCVSNQPT